MKRLIIFVTVILLLLAALPAAAQSNVVVHATAQRFEGGLMIWRSDTSHIWVLPDSGRAMSFPATSYSHLPDNAIFGYPPSRLRPIFGFGKVWGNFGDVRRALGWPLVPEVGFSMPVSQRNGVNYLGQLDGTTIQINRDFTWTRTTSIPSPVPRIASFSASPNPVVPGQPLTFTWSVEGASLALLEVYQEVNNTLIASLVELPTVGSASINVPSGVTSSLRAVVIAANRTSSQAVYNRLAQIELIVGIRLDVPVTTTIYGAYQPYDYGFMLWRSDNGMIITFSTLTQQTGFFYESSYAGLPENPVTDAIPAGRVRPIRGFGRVWGNFSYVRGVLGWATASEQGYQLTTSTLGTGPITFTLPDGRVATVSGNGSWRFS